MPDNTILPDNLLWLECLLRILIAVVLGSAIGIERQLRLKVAGIRTHSVVAVGAALFAIVSMYGFAGSDSARVAAQVVSGIGFIGAGMILHRQNAVYGLTSAAAIWLTAAIGMAAGSGLYLIALGSTVIMVLVQILMHIPIHIIKVKHLSEIKIVFKSPTDDCSDLIKKLFDIKSFKDFKAVRQGEEIIYSAVVHTIKVIDSEFICSALNEYPFIISIETNESDQ